MTSPSWRAATWRAENEPPSRSRSTCRIVGRSACPARQEVAVQRVDAAVVGHGEARGPGRLRRDLTAEQPRPADVAGRVHAAEDVAVELLEVEHGQELGDVARLGFAPLDRSRRVVHGRNRRRSDAGCYRAPDGSSRWDVASSCSARA